MKSKVVVFAGNGIGGTEKAASILASGLASRGWAVEYASAPGPRADYLVSEGVRLVEVQKTPEDLTRYLSATEAAVVHQHVPGYLTDNPLYNALAALGSRAPKLIETNHFGRLEDPAGDRFVQHRMFVSQASAVQAYRRARRALTRESLAQSTVVYNPLLPVDLPPVSSRESLRRELGLSPGDKLIIRLGQPTAVGLGKWTRWEVEAFRQARQRDPSLRLLLMEPPPLLADYARRVEGVLCLPATSDFNRLTALYAAADFMVHASSYGESFGYTIAEAMQAGLPVIVRSTPWGDNAQVELIQSELTGFVCGSIGEMARRMVELARDQARCAAMGQTARASIEDLAGAKQQVDIVEAVIQSVITGQRELLLDVRRDALLEFSLQFSHRQYQLSESFFRQPCGYVDWLLYAAYRTARTSAGGIYRRWRR